MKDWIPVINKLVWPLIIGLLLLIFNDQVGKVYSIAMDRLESGSSFAIGGFKLGEKANNTKIAELTFNDVPLEVIAERQTSVTRGVTKGGQQRLSALQREVENSPDRIINTMMIPDYISRYSVKLLKEYVSTLNLRYVVYTKGGEFDGWLRSQQFIAQLPATETSNLNYQKLRAFKGVSMNKSLPTASAKEVLQKMQESRTDVLPVIDENEKWLFMVNREDILSALMTSLLVSK